MGDLRKEFFIMDKAQNFCALSFRCVLAPSRLSRPCGNHPPQAHYLHDSNYCSALSTSASTSAGTPSVAGACMYPMRSP